MRPDDGPLSPEHVRALLKQAIGIINGDPWLVAEATADIAAIEAAGATREQERPDRPTPAPLPPRGT